MFQKPYNYYTMEIKNRHIYITTNIQCNLRCIYCYEDKSGNEVFDMDKAKKRLTQDLSQPSDDIVYINLHGGEPFLVFDKIKELCEWSWNQNFPTSHIFFATTNGTKVHGRIKQWLFENRHRFICGLSLDGTKEMHDMNRSNSFDQIDIAFFLKTWPSQGAKMTISPKSIVSLAEGVIYLHSIGFDNFDANLAYMVDWDKPDYLRIFYREMMKLSSFYKEHPNLRKCSLFERNFGILNQEDAKTRRWCGAGNEMEVYDIEGARYPCHLFFENVCGKEKSLLCHEIDFTNPEVYIQGECRTCPIYPICPTCYGANYIERGHIGLRDMNFCRMEKIRTLVIAKYQYDEIMNSNDDTDKLSAEELNKRLNTLDGIEKIMPALEEYQNMLKELL